MGAPTTMNHLTYALCVFVLGVVSIPRLFDSPCPNLAWFAELYVFLAAVFLVLAKLDPRADLTMVAGCTFVAGIYASAAAIGYAQRIDDFPTWSVAVLTPIFALLPLCVCCFSRAPVDVEKGITT